MFALMCVACIVGQAAPSQLENDMAVLDLLDSKLLAVEYRQETVKGILQDLQERLGVPVRGDWVALDRLGVEPDHRVDLHLNPSSAATVLAALTLAIGDEVERPVYEVHAGQVVLTRVAATAEMRQTSLYDVRDLLANDSLVQRLRDEAPVPAQSGAQSDTAANNPAESEPPGESTIPADPFIDGNPLNQGNDLPPTTTVAPPPLTPSERLLLLITDHIDPEAWMNFGGNRALISETNGVLVVSATPTTHRRLRNALTLLRSANSRSITIQASLIDVPQTQIDVLQRQHAASPAALAAALLAEPETKMIWRATDPVAVESSLEIESSSGDTTVHVSLTPSFDRSTGELQIVTSVQTHDVGDRRSVKTTLTLLSGQSSALVELPPLKPTELKRVLVLTIQRR